jgi:hypothetical protein
VNNAWPVELRLAPAGAKPEAAAVTRSEGSEATRKGGRKSECFTVSEKRGNRPEGPRGGKRAPEHGHV